MLNRIALLSIAGATLSVAALPHAASAADYYDEGRGSVVLHSHQDVEIDGGRADPEQPYMRRFAPRGPGPVVFDERGQGRGFDRPAYGGPEGGYRDPVFAEGPEYGGRGPLVGPGFGRAPLVDDGRPYRFAPNYRAVAAGAGGEVFDEHAGLPDVGCTVQQSQSVTPAGWRKIVTHRTCYRR